MLQLITTVLVTIATAFALQNPTQLNAAAVPAPSATVTSVLPITTSVDRTPDNVSANLALSAVNQVPVGGTVQEQVRTYFSDIPVLADVAECESTFRQDDSNGELLHGVVNPSDVGVMQINEFYNGLSAKNLGYDITTLEGNMEFARHLYDVYGLTPWASSEKCWSKLSEADGSSKDSKVALK